MIKLVRRFARWQIKGYKQQWLYISPIYSHASVLLRALLKHKPQFVYEYGSGISTIIISTCAPVVSIEHDKDWLDKFDELMPAHGRYGVVVGGEQDTDRYVRSIYEHENIGMAYIDGIERARCAAACDQYQVPVIVVHDINNGLVCGGVREALADNYDEVEDRDNTAVFVRR